MPIKPVERTFLIPMETGADVEALMERIREAAGKADGRRNPGFSRDVGDHLAYLAGTRPELFAPYQEELCSMPATALDGVGTTFEDLTLLMKGASEQCVNNLTSALRERPSEFFLRWILGSIGTEAALGELAKHAHATGTISELEDIGIEVPEAGPAVWRFSERRWAAFKEPGPRVGHPHPVGLSLEEVLEPPWEPVSWHYASIESGVLELGVPLPPRLHLLSPRADCNWTLYMSVRGDGRYAAPSLVRDEDGAHDETLRSIEESDGDKGVLRLRRYDGRLTYCNGHILLTQGVVGTVGGPPIGIYPNPKCRHCSRLMFHVLSFEHHVRSYGDGFRSLYVCEACQVVACTGTNWN